MRDGLAELFLLLGLTLDGRIGQHLHLNNTAVSGDIQDLAAELVGEVCDRLQVLVLQAQCLGGHKLRWVEVLSLCAQRLVQIGRASCRERVF